jgi:hypothetical protein
VADTRTLLAGLREYHNSLKRHLILVRQEFAEVEKQWYAFSSVYEGNHADQFRARWLNTTQVFHEYVDRSERIATILEERIEALQLLDNTTTG